MVLVDVLAGHSLRGSLVLWGQWHLQPQWGEASMLFRHVGPKRLTEWVPLIVVRLRAGDGTVESVPVGLACGEPNPGWSVPPGLCPAGGVGPGPVVLGPWTVPVLTPSLLPSPATMSPWPHHPLTSWCLSGAHCLLHPSPLGAPAPPPPRPLPPQSTMPAAQEQRLASSEKFPLLGPWGWHCHRSPHHLRVPHQGTL